MKKMNEKKSLRQKNEQLEFNCMVAGDDDRLAWNKVNEKRSQGVLKKEIQLLILVCILVLEVKTPKVG